MSSAITDAFAHDHHRCDHLHARAETQVSSGDWAAASDAAETLIEAMDRHFQLEEETLFPALARVFRVAANPIEVMRSEHAQMRHLFADLRTAVEAKDTPSCVGILETLHFLVQQHNYKEETVLYPMADGALKDSASEMVNLVVGV